MIDKAILIAIEKSGWVIECESPLEVRHEESNSFATNRAAKYIIDTIKQGEEI